MARFLIDVNMPPRLALWSTDEFVFMHALGPTWSDREIWDHALAHGLAIVTKDTDFSDRVLLEGAGPRVVHFRIGNLRMRQFHALATNVWGDVCHALETNRIVQVFPDRIESIE